MSAAIVRKALELSDDTPGPLEKSLKNAGKKKLKSIQKKKNKLSPEKLLKKNLKILKALEFSTKNTKKYGSAPTNLPGLTSKSKKAKKKQKKQESTVFTEEDFAKFEKEYFVTD